MNQYVKITSYNFKIISILFLIVSNWYTSNQQGQRLTEFLGRTVCQLFHFRNFRFQMSRFLRVLTTSMGLEHGQEPTSYRVRVFCLDIEC